MSDAAPRWRTPLVLALLALAAIVPYLQVLNFEFVIYDDKHYVWGNHVVREGLTWSNVIWAFTTTKVSNWHPLTWLSHMLDVELWGLWAGGHHLTNLLFHTLNTLLLFGILYRMTAALWRSALVAALFAAHPLHVESVVWVAERKDMLSTFFGLLAIWSYVEYARQPKIGRYVLVLFLFALSLLSKPMLVTLPCVLLLLDYWPLRRMRFGVEPANNQFAPVRSLGWLLLEKVPFVPLVVASSLVTIYAQHAGGAMYPLDVLPIPQRIDNAMVAYVQYLSKMIWPVNMAVMYPLPDHWPIGTVLASGAILLVISFAAIVLRQRYPHVLIGWLWYLGTLVPVIGLLQVGMQSMADRYTYVPLIGIFMMIAWSLPGAFGRMQPKRVHAAAAASVAVVVVLMLRTWVQAGYWQNSKALFDHALAVTRGNHVAHTVLGILLEQQGRYEEAIEEYNKVLAMYENYRTVRFNLANSLTQLGRVKEAIPHYEKALRLAPESAVANHNLGVAYFRAGRLDEAIVHYREALRLSPKYADAHFNLGLALANQRKTEEAIVQYQEAILEAPFMAEAHSNLGIAYATLGRLDEAIASFEEALRLKPDDAQVKLYLQTAQQQQRELQGQSQ